MSQRNNINAPPPFQLSFKVVEAITRRKKQIILDASQIFCGGHIHINLETAHSLELVRMRDTNQNILSLADAVRRISNIQTPSLHPVLSFENDFT